MKFCTGNLFPSFYLHQIFITENGSWSRSEPIGYRINTNVFDKQVPLRYEIFADGWLQDDKARGRPVDVLILQDGSLLVSNDRAGTIYRITDDRSP